MLFLRSSGDSLARIDAPKPSFWSKMTSSLSKASSAVTKTTKVASGIFAAGVIVAATAISFGAIPLIAGGALAIAGIGVYAYGKITETVERKSYIKPIFKAPPKDLDFTYIAPNNKPPAPAANPAPVKVSSAPAKAASAPVKNPPAPSKKNADKENLEMIFPNRGVKLGQKVQPLNVSRKPLTSRQAVVA